MRASHVVLVLLVVAGICASVFVIPRDRELALMYLKGLDYESAQLALETRLDGGDFSVGVVIPLTRVYLEISDFDAAVALMERFVARNPENPDALEELAQLYKQASRTYDYIVTLETLARVRPTDKTLRELSDYYGDRGNVEKQVEVLRQLVQRPNPRMEDWFDLATVEAGLNNYEEAAAALHELDRRYKVPRTQNTVEFYISVLARTGKEEAAVALAADWARQTTSPLAVIGVTRQLAGAGKDPLALTALDAANPEVAGSRALFSERVRIELRLGRRAVAFQRLKEAHDEGKLPPEFDDDLIDLALERNLVPLAFEVALKGSPLRLPEWQLTSLVGMAPPERMDEVAKWAIEAPDFLERRPALAAAVLKAVGQPARALQMAERALAQPGELPPDQILRLIVLLADLGRAEDARRHLTEFAGRVGWEENTAVDIANTMIRLDMADEGWRRIQALRERQRARPPALDVAWALLGAATGKADQVIEWLEGPGAGQLDAVLLDQLVGLSEMHGQPKLAVAAARRLVALKDSPETRLQLAGALLALGRIDEALVEAGPLRRNSGEAERIYLIALSTLAKKGDGAAQKELAETWQEILARPGLQGEELAAVVYSLLERGFGREAMLAIFWLGERLPENWLPVVAEESKKVRREADARAFLARQLERADLSAAAREQALFALLEVGGAAEALPELARLAEVDRGDQWLYAYVDAAKKARREADARAFLARQLGRTDLSAATREQALFALIELGGAADALPELARLAHADRGDQWFYAYVDAAKKAGRKADLRSFLAAEVKRTDLSKDRRDARLYAFIDAVGAAEALPEIKRFAETHGGDRVNVYDEALAKLGRTDERRKLLLAQAARPGLSAKEKREIGYRLIELGDRNAAIGLFRDLAATAKPEDEIVEELVYLWREAKQPQAALALLASRAASAAPGERPGWARRLIDINAPARALAALGPDDPAEPAETTAVRIDALVALRRSDEAGRLIAARAEGERDLPKLRRLARQALEVDSKPALRAVYGRIVREVPNDPEANRWIGLAEFGEGRAASARRYLAVVADTALADHEVNAAYGEILLQAGDREAARFRFRKALEQMTAIPDPPPAIRVSRALMLNRLGDSAQALSQMAALLAERPSDANLRADYANLLMDNKLYDQARRVLAGQ
jgi:lipopolysaccharide biosynthesis regulator YciM